MDEKPPWLSSAGSRAGRKFTKFPGEGRMLALLLHFIGS